MPRFGRRSKTNLRTAHLDLIRLFDKVIKEYDCSILQGYRNQEEQDRLYYEGRSKLQYPDSKHNSNPSLAVDVIPYPIDWNDRERFYHFAGYVKGVASGLGIKIRWGGDWDRDGDLTDQNFNDLFHIEIIDNEQT